MQKKHAAKGLVVITVSLDPVKEKDQPVPDRLHREYSGRPVSEVRPAVAQALRAAGWTLSDEDLDDEPR